MPGRQKKTDVRPTQKQKKKERWSRALIHHPYPLLHRDLVVVADGVFTQEVELHHKLLPVLLGVQVDVLHTQRAAAHRVRRLPLLLLVTRSQSQLVRDKQQGVSIAVRTTFLQ